MQRRQALAGAQCSVNKVAQSVSQTMADTNRPDIPTRDESGGAWVRDGGPQQGRMMGQERSKRRLLLKAARVSLERAQAKVVAKGGEIKQQTDRGLVKASGHLARGLRKLMPRPDGKEESEVMKNVRLIADYTVSAAEVARIRELRMQQEQAGRYVGRQRRAQAAPQRNTPIMHPSSDAAEPTPQGPGRGNPQPTCTQLPTGLRPHQGALAEASSSSMNFDLVGDEELLYAYQIALDELDNRDTSDEAEETEIIALAVSQMDLHPDLNAFAINRLYELVGLGPQSLQFCAEAKNAARPTGVPSDQSQTCVAMRSESEDDDEDDENDEDGENDYISAFSERRE